MSRLLENILATLASTIRLSSSVDKLNDYERARLEANTSTIKGAITQLIAKQCHVY